LKLNISQGIKRVLKRGMQKAKIKNVQKTQSLEKNLKKHRMKKVFLIGVGSSGKV
jgi:fructoselysine-6-P-deglycase FrlB-like protein